MTQKQKRSTKALVLDSILSFIYLILFLLFVAVFYFLILISVEPKSFPVVTKKVEQYINNNLAQGNTIKIGKIAIELNNVYKLNLILENIDFELGGKSLILPKINTQFSVFNLLINRKPTKIKFENADITLDQNQLDLLNTLTESKQHTINNKSQEGINNTFLKRLWDFFSALKNKDIFAKEFEINNVSFSFKDKNTIIHKTLIKYSDIKIRKKNGDLLITLKNIVNLPNNKNEAQINASCLFNEDISLKCNIDVTNIDPIIFANISDKTKFLSKVSTSLDTKFKVEIDKNYQLTSILFDANSKKGNFIYDSLFAEKINFHDLNFVGEIKNSLKDIKISELSVNFDKDIKFKMVSNIKNLNDPNLEETEMYFNISNVSGNKITKFWPVFLVPHIREWVLNHISSGTVKDAYASIKVRKKNNIKIIEDIDSEILFSKLALKYHQSMPEITNIDGIASFDKDRMNIDLVAGDVLQSKIKIAKVAIDNFHNKNHIILKISGVVSGNGSDPLKHISYKTTFSSEVEKYLNGKGDTTFTIQAPLKSNLSLNDTYIKVLSDIKNANSKFLEDNSSLQINVFKDFNSDNFKTFIDISNAKVNLENINIKKNKEIPSTINLNIIFKNDTLSLERIKWLIGKNYVNSDLKFNIKPFTLIKADIKTNFNNNYNLHYETNKNNSSHIEINGNYLNLSPILKALPLLIANKSDHNSFNGLIIKTNLKKVDLSKNQSLNNLNININCTKTYCADGFIKAKMKDNNFIEINLKKVENSNHTNILGRISDISLLARGFNISDQIIGGNSTIKATLNTSNGKINSIEGNLFINKNFSVIKTEIFEKIVKDKAFESLRNDIHNSEKINFSKLDLDFSLKDNILEIEKLIASSYLLGFTAKGTINLQDSSTTLKGLIIPGYKINTLFGVGNIPVLGSILMGEEGGGIFAIRYEYSKNKDQKKGEFNINAASVIVPGSIRNLLQLFD